MMSSSLPIDLNLHFLPQDIRLQEGSQQCALNKSVKFSHSWKKKSQSERSKNKLPQQKRKSHSNTIRMRMTYRAHLFPAIFQVMLKSKLLWRRLSRLLHLTNQSSSCLPSIRISTTFWRLYSVKYRWRKMEKGHFTDKHCISSCENYSKDVDTREYSLFTRKVSIFC